MGIFKNESELKEKLDVVDEMKGEKNRLLDLDKDKLLDFMDKEDAEFISETVLSGRQSSYKHGPSEILLTSKPQSPNKQGFNLKK